MGKVDLVKKGFNYISSYGVKGFTRKLQERLTPEVVPYKDWYPKHFIDQEQREEQLFHSFSKNPLISIVVPTYHTPKDFLVQLIDSVQDQTYGKFELCIADGSDTNEVEAIVTGYSITDTRIRYKRLEENKGISENTNAGIKMAQGEYIALLDHDDFLEPNALFEVVKLINEVDVADVIYTDEDKSNKEGKEFFNPHFKSGFNLDLLRSNNYICHFLVVRRELAGKIGLLNKEYDGAQDYDFVLRLAENTNNIHHVSKVVYHWRVSENSTAENPNSKKYAYEAGKRAIEAHLNRCGIKGSVSNAQDLGFYRVKYYLNETPKISIIIASENNQCVTKCVDSVRGSRYEDFEFFVVDNTSEAINKCVSEEAQGDYVAILNEELIINESDWMEELVSQCQRNDIGVTGVRIFTPSRRIMNKGIPLKATYHAGMVAGMGGVVGNAFKGLPANLTGYMHKASILGNCSAVSALMFMTKKDLFIKLGGFDDNLSVGLAGPDYCFRVQEAGLRILYDPYVSATYFGSGMKLKSGDKEYMKNKWESFLSKGDPYYNENFTLESPGYILREN